MRHPRHRRAALARRTLRSFALSALPLIAWACHDTTGPASDPAQGTPSLAQTSPYYCTTRTYTSAAGVREGSVSLGFPPEARAADGSTMEYRYRRKTPAGAQTYAADCVIPRTMSALDLMNQRFRVPVELRMPPGRDRDGNEYTTQGCVSDGECELEPIDVVAPPTNCDYVAKREVAVVAGTTAEGAAATGVATAMHLLIAALNGMDRANSSNVPAPPGMVVQLTHRNTATKSRERSRP